MKNSNAARRIKIAQEGQEVHSEAARAKRGGSKNAGGSEAPAPAASSESPPPSGKDRVGSLEDALDVQDWMAWASWTFCPLCGHRRPNGKLTPHWWRRGASAVSARCKGGCDPHPQDLWEAERWRKGWREGNGGHLIA